MELWQNLLTKKTPVHTKSSNSKNDDTKKASSKSKKTNGR